MRSAIDRRDETWCVFDLETTGLFPGRHDRVIEVGLVVLNERGEPISEWHSLVNPNRDLGEVSVHGITADLARQAPTFAELSGDIAELLNGRRLIAHNAAFDCDFLRTEFGRADVHVESLDALCTMHLASRVGVGRSLESCCNAAEIDNEAPHTALGDARATAELFAYLLTLERRHGDRLELRTDVSPVRLPRASAPSGRALPRVAAATSAKPRSYLARLAGRLPTPAGPDDVSADRVAAYADLLQRVLEDRVVDSWELDDLLALAERLGLGRSQLEKINLSYLRGLASVALADGEVNREEMHDLERVSSLLGVPRSQLAEILKKPATNEDVLHPGDCEEFAGLSVCFTGSSGCTLAGKRLSRDFATEIATNAGMRVAKGVTKTLDVLVVADPDTLSGKAKKARAYGTRIIGERAFWPRLGVPID